MKGEALVVVVNLEHNLGAIELEAAKIVLVVRVVGGTELVKDSDGLDEALNCFLPKSGDPRRYNRTPTEKVSAQFIVERAYAIRVHIGHGYFLSD